MAQFKHILVVIDPTREDQPALLRAARVAQNTDGKIDVYCCLDKGAPTGDDRAAKVRLLLADWEQKLDTLVAPLVEAGLRVRCNVEWHPEWSEAVVESVRKTGADAVFKSSNKYPPGQRVLKHAGDWTLMRECDCPVLLVRESGLIDSPKVLAAVDIQADRGHYTQLNTNILSFTRRIAANDSADIHVINAFRDFRSVPDRSELVEESGLDSSHVHIRHGKPAKVIVDKAREMGADLVVVGNSARTGISAMVIGNTVEKILGKLDCDVLSVPD